MKRMILVATVIVASLNAIGPVAVAENLSVPGDYATIQEAVNAAAPWDTISVEAGSFAGAVIWGKPVTIIGSPGAIIHEGAPFFGGVDGFDLVWGADGTTIRDLIFVGDLFWGVVGFGVDGVTVTDCVFLDTYNAVVNSGGDTWTITGNVIDGFIPYLPPGPGVENHQEAILLMAPARGNYIGDNWIRHEGDRNPGYAVEYNNGVALASFGDVLEDNFVVGNEIEVAVPDADASVGVGLYAFGNPSAIRNNTVVDNDLRRSLTPIFLLPQKLRASNVVQPNLIH